MPHPGEKAMQTVRLPALIALVLCPMSMPAQATGEVIATPNNGPAPLALETTKGERHGRLIIRGGIVLSGRGTPGTNRAMPPEGPIDIVIIEPSSLCYFVFAARYSFFVFVFLLPAGRKYLVLGRHTERLQY
jgi:hypothetical protein